MSSGPWSARDEKPSPLVSSDQFMILDSEDTVATTQNQRCTLSTAQQNIVTDIDANNFNITNIEDLEVAALSLVPTNPTLVGSIMSQSQLNGIRGIYVVGEYAYSITQFDDSLVIVNIADPTAPSIVGDLQSANMNTPSGVFVSGNYAYVSAFVSNSLSIIDITNSAVPTLVGTLTDTVLNRLTGANDVYVSGKYAYVAAQTANTLVIIDISTPTSPTITGSIRDNTNLNNILSVYVVGNYAYVTSKNNNSISSIDISDPRNPFVAATRDDSALIGADRLYVQGNYAYVLGRTANTLVIVDISNPLVLSVTGVLFDASFSTSALDIFVAGNYAYVTIGVAPNGSLRIIDVSDPVNPTQVGSIFDPTFGGVEGVYVSGKYAYLALQQADTLAIIDINGIDSPSASIGSLDAGYLSVTSNAVIRNDLYAGSLSVGNNASVGNSLSSTSFSLVPNNPTISGLVQSAAELDGASSVYVVGDYAYVADSDDSALTIVNISDPTNPTIVTEFVNSNMNGARSVFVSGNFAYVASEDSNSLTIVDITNPAVPTFVGTTPVDSLLTGAFNVYVSGKYAYVVSGTGGNSLTIIDVSDPTTPTITGSITGAALNFARTVYVVGNFAYVTSAGNESLSAIDISDPVTPTIADTLVSLVGVIGLYVQGNYAYTVSATNNTLSIIDISDPTALTLKGSFSGDFGNSALAVFVAGNYAYVTSFNNASLTIIDVTDPTNPTLVEIISDSTNLIGARSVYVSGKYAYVASDSADSLVVIDINGIDSPSASIGSVDAGYLSVTSNAVVRNDLYAGSVNVANDVFVGGSLIGVPNIPAFSEFRNYVVGDLVVEDGITFRAIANVPAGVFLQTLWIVSDGVGAKNVVQVFAPSDFGPNVGGNFQLSQETEYIICAEIDLGSNGLQLPDTAIVTFRTFNKENNKIESTAADVLKGVQEISGTYTASVLEGSDRVRFSVPATGNLTVNNRVNIEGTFYKLNNQQIVAIVSDDFFDIVTPNLGDEMGDWNNFAVKVEMAELEIEGSGSNNGVSIDFTTAGSSEWYAHHCDFEKLSVPLSIDRTMLAITTLCEFEETGTVLFEQMNENIIFSENSFFEPIDMVGVYNLEIIGNGTDVINALIANNSFESSVTTNAIHIKETSTFPAATKFVVTGNLDKTDSATLFESPTDNGVNQTDLHLIVKSNGRQRNSAIAALEYLLFVNSFTVTIDDPNTFTSATDAGWAITVNERMTQSNGTITYDGFDETKLLVKFSCTIEPTITDGNIIAAGMSKNDVEIDDATVHVNSAQTGTRYHLSSSFPVDMENTDILNFGVRNNGNDDDIVVHEAHVSISVIG